MDWNVFRSEGLAKALTDAGHGVSARTIDRWKSGTSKPSKGQLRAIRKGLRAVGGSALVTETIVGAKTPRAE